MPGIFARAFLLIGAGVLGGSGLTAHLRIGSTRDVQLLFPTNGVMLIVGLTACAVQRAQHRSDGGVARCTLNIINGHSRNESSVADRLKCHGGREHSLFLTSPWMVIIACSRRSEEASDESCQPFFAPARFPCIDVKIP